MMTNWNAITDYFLSMVNHPRHGQHAREMFKLCLILREEPDLVRFRVQANYLYLRITAYNSDDYVVVTNESPECYTIAIHEAENDATPIDVEQNIELGYFLPVIFYFLSRIQDNDDPVTTS